MAIILRILWVAEARMLSICGVSRTIFAGWVKAGLIVRDDGGAYDLATTLKVVLLANLREVFALDDLKGVWKSLEDEGVVAAVLEHATELSPGDRLDLVVDPDGGGVTVALTDQQLLAAVRPGARPRTVTVRPLAEELQYARRAFERFASSARRPTSRKAGRPPGRKGEVRELRGDA
jgi:hypothetical protein